MERLTGRHRNLPANLPQLQNLIKRDPSAYHEEFMQQFHHYQSLRELLLQSPAQEATRLGEIVMFTGQVMSCYPEDLVNFPLELKQLLQMNSSVLHPDVRMILCRALILLRNKGVIEPDFVLELFFELFCCQDKALRVVLYSHIVADIKRINAKHKNNKVNTMLQNFMYTMLSGSSKIAARMSLDVMIELYRKNVWRDTKTVNILATACLSPVTKIMGAAICFFLTEEDGLTDVKSESSDESDAESRALRDIVLSRQTVKSGRKRKRKVAKARAILKKQHKKHRAPTGARFMAVHLIHDPQDLAEKLFHRLEKSTERFELKLLIIALISRLTGVHQLFVFNFYPFLQRYLQPHQKEVTKILTCLAQACHDLVPPEVLEPIVKAVANNFITERNSSDAIAMGLNTMREVCMRCPLVMNRELLADLAGYKSYRDKGVVMAARSLIQLYRTVKPELLQRRDRGKPVECAPQRAREYGELVAEEYVPETEIESANIVPESREELLSEEAITTIRSKLKRSKEERILSSKADRQIRAYGHKRAKLNPHSSTTNQQKAKSKSFTMMRQKRSIRAKGKRSFRERQIALRKSLLKRRKK